jgi:hypothetical protein
VALATERLLENVPCKSPPSQMHIGIEHPQERVLGGRQVDLRCPLRGGTRRRSAIAGGWSTAQRRWRAWP